VGEIEEAELDQVIYTYSNIHIPHNSDR